MKSLMEHIALIERYVNAFQADTAIREQYADQVWAILQASYTKIGGLKSTGFGSAQEMIDTIPFWKLGVRDGKVRAVMMYKDKNGRKGTAAGTDGSPEGKELLKDILRNDFSRSYIEVSHDLLRFMKYNFPEEMERYAISPEKAKAITGKDSTPIDDPDEYVRMVAGEPIRKRMVGTPGKTIK